jgi:DNA-binding FadR family transcriptional regulator
MADPGRKRAAEETADRIRDDILTGVHQAGENLPGERELATQLGVSRLTLRSALARLEAEGLVRAVHGKGNVVQDYRKTGGIDLLGYLAQLAMEGREVPLGVLGELLELRRAIAIEALGLAAERGEEADFAALGEQLVAMKRLIDTPRDYMLADLAFARLVVRATKNIAFELAFNTVYKVAADNPALELAYHANARQTVQVYGRLLELMKKREAHRIRQVTARLLSRLDRRTLALIEAVGGATD